MTEKNVNLRFSNSLLKEELENKEKELELKYESKAYNMEHEYKKEINKLKQENKHLNKIIDKFKVTLKNLLNGFVISFRIRLRMNLYAILRKKHILTLILKNNSI